MSRDRKTSPAAPAGAKELSLSTDFDFALRVLVAVVIGLILGFEREFHGHPAGMRTMALIAGGSCLFTAIGAVPEFGIRVDPTRIAAQIVTGVGFLGAGSILRQGEEVKGLTTAATIWVVASLGMAVGFGYYGLATLSTVLVVVALVAVRPIEDRFFPARRNRRRDDPQRQPAEP
jgi:putative Mg2+ transporter-C (MgtC) family protein